MDLDESTQDASDSGKTILTRDLCMPVVLYYVTTLAV